MTPTRAERERPPDRSSPWNKRQVRGSRAGATSPDAAGQPGQDNPAGGQQPPAVDPQLRKLTEGLQKKGLLNPNAGQGNSPPPQSNDAANPQGANPGDGTQQPQSGSQNQSGNAGRQSNPQRNAMPNPPSPAGNPTATPPQPQGSQAPTTPVTRSSPGRRGRVNLEATREMRLAVTRRSLVPGRSPREARARPPPATRRGTRERVCDPGQRDNAQSNMNPQDSQAGTQTQPGNPGDRQADQANQGGTRTAGPNDPRSDGSTRPAGKTQDRQDTTDPTQKKDSTDSLRTGRTRMVRMMVPNRGPGLARFRLQGRRGNVPERDGHKPAQGPESLQLIP